MTIDQLQDSYRVGDIDWTDHGDLGTRRGTIQYDMNGNADDHITIDYDHRRDITGMHYTVCASGTSLHLYYYVDNNTFHLDQNGFHGLDGGDVEDAKYHMAGFCRATHYAMNAFNGKYTFKTREFLNS